MSKQFSDRIIQCQINHILETSLAQIFDFVDMDMFFCKKTNINSDESHNIKLHGYIFTE